MNNNYINYLQWCTNAHDREIPVVCNVVHIHTAVKYKNVSKNSGNIKRKGKRSRKIRTRGLRAERARLGRFAEAMEIAQEVEIRMQRMRRYFRRSLANDL